jgi:hypothetical protein
MGTAGRRNRASALSDTARVQSPKTNDAQLQSAEEGVQTGPQLFLSLSGFTLGF